MNHPPPAGYTAYPPPPTQQQQHQPYEYPYPYALPGASTQSAQNFQYDPQQQGQTQQSPASFFRTWQTPLQQFQNASISQQPQQQQQQQQVQQVQSQTQQPQKQRQQRQNVTTTAPPAPPSTVDPPTLQATQPTAPPSAQNQPDTSMTENLDPPHPTYGPHGTDTHGAIYLIPAPPESSYPSEASLENALHAWSLLHGYELVRRASRKNKHGELYKRYYHCSKHGHRTNKHNLTEASRVRSVRKSGRIDCPMSLAAVAISPSDPEGQWEVRHRKSHHNHPPAPAIELTGHRRRARGGQVEQVLDGLFAVGTKTSDVLTFLKKTHQEGLFTRADVANMKMRWKKWGSCADRVFRGEEWGRGNGRLAGVRRRHGVNQVEGEDGVNEDGDGSQEDDAEAEEGGQQVDLTTSPTADPATTTTSATNRTTRTATKAPAAAEAKKILSQIRAFTTTHAKPSRLQLDSPSVEVLAYSSCGNGDSFLSLPVLASEREWPEWKERMNEAAMREGCRETLCGIKTAPSKPSAAIPFAAAGNLGAMSGAAAAGGTGAGANLTAYTLPGQMFPTTTTPTATVVAPVAPASQSEPAQPDIEIWNTYIQTLAIHNRRNTLLLSTLLSKTSPLLRSRIASLTSAAEAWRALEDFCAPRGSVSGFEKFCEIQRVASTGILDGESSVKNFAARLEKAWEEYRNLLQSSNPGYTDKASGMEEGWLCFLFLSALKGAEWATWREGVCATGNLGGFGTGGVVGFKEVVRAALRREGGV